MRSSHCVSPLLTLSGKSWSLMIMTTMPIAQCTWLMPNWWWREHWWEVPSYCSLYLLRLSPQILINNTMCLEIRFDKAMCYRDPFFTTYPEVAFQEGSFDTTVCSNSFAKTLINAFTNLFIQKVDVLLGSNTQEGLLFTQVNFQPKIKWKYDYDLWSSFWRFLPFLLPSLTPGRSTVQCLHSRSFSFFIFLSYQTICYLSCSE